MARFAIELLIIGSSSPVTGWLSRRTGGGSMRKVWRAPSPASGAAIVRTSMREPQAMPSTATNERDISRVVDGIGPPAMGDPARAHLLPGNGAYDRFAPPSGKCGQLAVRPLEDSSMGAHREGSGSAIALASPCR